MAMMALQSIAGSDIEMEDAVINQVAAMEEEDAERQFRMSLLMSLVKRR